MVQQVLSTDDHTGHDRVVIGYDDVHREIITHDPNPDNGPSYILSYDQFAILWADLSRYTGQDLNESYIITPTPAVVPVTILHIPALTIQGLPALPVTIDGNAMTTDENGALQTQLPWGPHLISVPPFISVSEGVREAFVSWSDKTKTPSRFINIVNNVTLSVEYKTQYYLNVASPYGATSGSGWYFANETGAVSVEPTTVSADGFLGVVGAKHVFDHWLTDCATNAACSVVMDRPKNIIAVWKDDYTIPALYAIGLVLILGIAIFMRSRHAIRQKSLRN